MTININNLIYILLNTAYKLSKISIMTKVVFDSVLTEMMKLDFDTDNSKIDPIANTINFSVCDNDYWLNMFTCFCNKCGQIKISNSQVHWRIISKNTKCKCKVYYPRTINNYNINEYGIVHRKKMSCLSELINNRRKQDMVIITEKVISSVLNIDFNWDCLT